MFSIFEFILLGLFVGGITGITGASGVLIIVPVLTTFFDMPLPVILGTSLLVDVIASIAVSIAYARSKNLDIKGSLWILIGSLLGARIGSIFVVSISKIFIMAVLSICMIFFGSKMWVNGLRKSKHNFIVLPDYLSHQLKTPIGMILMGLAIGVITGIFGAGGGLVIFIVLYSLLRFPIKMAIGTSTFIMLLTALSGTLGYAHNNNLDISIGLIVGISAAVGGGFSSVFANRIKEENLSKLIGAFFIFMALVMLILKVIFPLIGLEF